MAFGIQGLGLLNVQKGLENVQMGLLNGRTCKPFNFSAGGMRSSSKDIKGLMFLFIFPFALIAAIIGIAEIIFSGGKSHVIFDEIGKFLTR